MNNKGCWGFHRGIENATKVTLNNLDAYPEFLGHDVVTFVKSSSLKQLNEIFDTIILTNHHDNPTKQQLKECKKITGLKVSKKTHYTWQYVLEDSQGKPNLYKKGLKYMLNAKNFTTDNFRYDWAYIINLDENILEIYKGGNKKAPRSCSRYTTTIPKEGFYSCEIVTAFPLEKIPDNWIDIIYQNEHEAQ